jgi:VWFA-related protein
LRKTFSIFCLFGGIAVGVACSAQTVARATPAPPTPTAAPAVAATATPDELTTIDLLVHDRKGHSVTDIKPEELAVTDDGATMKIASLRLVNGAQGHDRLVTLVFGRLDLPSMKNARGIAAKLLKIFPDGGFTYAVLGVDGRLRLYQPYTSDRAALVHPIESATTPEGAVRQDVSSSQEKALLALRQSSASTGDAAASTQQTQAKALYAALERSQNLVQDRHIDPDLAGLTAIADAERQLPGRKAILYFTQSAQPDVNTVDQMRATAKAANQAGTSIYVIDMNALDAQVSDGMVAAATMGQSMAYQHFNPIPPASAQAPPAMGSVQSLFGPAEIKSMQDATVTFEVDGMAANKSPLGILSAQTGGVCAGASENLKKPVERLVADLSSYYELTYDPRIEIYDGRYHPVAVKTQRTGVLLRATSGYFALPHGEEAAAPELLEASLASALKSATPPADIAFRSAALQFGKVDDGIAVELAVEVPIANLEAHEDPNTDLFSLHAAVAARVEDQSGKVLHEFSEDIRKHGGLDSLDAVRATNISFDRRVTLAPGDYILKSVVVDSTSGKAGVQSTPFHIAPTTAGPSLGDLVLLSQHGATADSLRSSEGKVIPNLTGNIPAGAKNISLFFMAHSGEKDAAQPQVAVALAEDGKQIGQWPLHAANEKQKTLVPYLGSLNTATLPAGKYDVTVTLKQGEETAERHLVFVKEAGVEASPSVEAAVDALIFVPAPLLDASTKSTTAPPKEQVDALIEAARKRALSYSAKLPNFMCVEIIDRSADRTGKGHWTHLDNITELLRYHDNAESRVVLEVDGHRSNLDHEAMKGAHSNGEFGGLLKAIFDPAVAAQFTWKSEKVLSSGVTVQVFSYQVAQKHSNFGLTDNNNWTLNVAFRGELYIEAETGAVRYASLEAQELPAKFTVHATNIQVVYDYIAINNHDYLLPVQGTLTVSEGKHQVVLNSLQFRDYKRFSSQSRILPVTETASTK